MNSVGFSFDCEFDELLDFAIFCCQGCVEHLNRATDFVVVILCVESKRQGLNSLNLFKSIIEHEFLDTAPIWITPCKESLSLQRSKKLCCSNLILLDTDHNRISWTSDCLAFTIADCDIGERDIQPHEIVVVIVENTFFSSSFCTSVENG